MKTKKILNILAFVLVIVGVFFKALHYSGANAIIMLAGLILIINLFAFCIKDNKAEGLGNGLNYLLVGTLALFIVGAIFKIMHYSGANILLNISYVLAILIPLILIFQKDTTKISLQFIITFLIFFVLVISVIPNNPIQKQLKCSDKTIVNEDNNTELGDSTTTITDTVK
ncbi:MAG: hypothetical protein AUJ98_01130 [Bacteroidetes bacterium CG2_30_33_31]|nr:MAG: hypothetical protein AUJ98_01130 [Bacteroidetes bacterium CG2_30_33_31]